MNSKTMIYILKRIILAILTVWVVITVTFFVMHAVPGGPFTREKAISAEAQAALEAKYADVSMETPENGSLYKDAYSAMGTVTVSSEKASATVPASSSIARFRRWV